MQGPKMTIRQKYKLFNIFYQIPFKEFGLWIFMIDLTENDYIPTMQKIKNKRLHVNIQ
jgi:hypothetical protein